MGIDPQNRHFQHIHSSQHSRSSPGHTSLGVSWESSLTGFVTQSRSDEGYFSNTYGREYTGLPNRIYVRWSFNSPLHFLCFLSLILQLLQPRPLRRAVLPADLREQPTAHFALSGLSSHSRSSSPPATWPPAPSTATTPSLAIPRAVRSSLRALPSRPTLPSASGAAVHLVLRWDPRWEALEQQVGELGEGDCA